MFATENDPAAKRHQAPKGFGAKRGRPAHTREEFPSLPGEILEATPFLIARQAPDVCQAPDVSGSPFSVNLVGLGLSDSTDGDNDGMNDWAEYVLRGFGFDWQNAQSNLVGDYYGLAPEAGLVALDQVAGLQAGAVLLDINSATNRAEFTIELKQSPDLVTPYAPIVADPARLSVDAQGRLVYEVDAPGERRFYLMTIEQ